MSSKPSYARKMIIPPATSGSAADHSDVASRDDSTVANPAPTKPTRMTILSATIHFSARPIAAALSRLSPAIATMTTEMSPCLAAVCTESGKKVAP